MLDVHASQHVMAGLNRWLSSCAAELVVEIAEFNEVESRYMSTAHVICCGSNSQKDF
jgi:hypothetical protein